MMTIMHQHVAGNKDHMSISLNPAAQPFSPLQKNQHPNPNNYPSNSLRSRKPAGMPKKRPDPAAPPFRPILHQPHILPDNSGYYYQPCISGYMNPVQVFVHPVQRQPQYYAANFCNPIFGPWPLVKPQFLGHAPCYQLGQPSRGSRSLNSGVPLASLRAKIVQQIEYYFSDENLTDDHYLISLMDDQGWVPISIVAKFKRVANMCTDTPFILDSLLFGSSIVEVQGNKIRRRDGWSKWISS